MNYTVLVISQQDLRNSTREISINELIIKRCLKILFHRMQHDQRMATNQIAIARTPVRIRRGRK